MLGAGKCAVCPLTNANFSTAVELWFSNEASATETYGHIRDWDTSAVTNMGGAFEGKATFNEDISGWDVGNVTDMNKMFKGASTFNQPIGSWDTSKVTKMGRMFMGAASFNQPIGTWDTSAVTGMLKAFSGCTAFNQNISRWDISSVTNMDDMFSGENALTNSKKGLIHASFSANESWKYEWADFVPTALTDANFNTAIALWFSDEAAAIETYGHISDWNVPPPSPK